MINCTNPELRVCISFYSLRNLKLTSLLSSRFDALTFALLNTTRSLLFSFIFSSFFFLFWLTPYSLTPFVHSPPPPSPHHETVTIARSKDSLNEYWRNKTKMVIMIDWMSSILLRRHDTLSLSNMNVCISQGRRDSDIDLRKVR